MEFEQTDTHRCYLAAIRLLARQDYSEYKLRKKLKEKKFIEEDIDKTIQEVIELNYLQEHEYRKARIRGFLRKGLADSFIFQKLAQEFCTTTQDEIDTIREEIGLSEQDQIQELLEKKLRGQNMEDLPINEKAKVIRFLSSKGHRYNSNLFY